MRQSWVKLAVVTVVAVAAVGLLRVCHSSRSGHGQTDAADDPGLIDGRVWVEARPDKLTDYVHVAFFFSRSNFGLFERASSYDIRLELADVTRSREKLSVHFPQSKKDADVTFTVKTCTDKKPFDLCLDLSANPWGGPRRYHGFSTPEEESTALGPLAAQVRASSSRP